MNVELKSVVDPVVVPLRAPTPRTRPSLPARDARAKLDEAVRRGWVVILRRAARLAALVAADGLAALLGAFLLGSLLDMLSATGTTVGGALWTPFGAVLAVLPLTLGAVGAYGLSHGGVKHGRLLLGVAFGTVFAGLQARILAGEAGILGSPWIIGGYTAITWPLLILGRRLVRVCIRTAYKLGIGLNRVLVVGTAEEVQRLQESLDRRQIVDVRIEGFITPSDPPDAGALGSLAELDHALQRTGATGIIVSSSLLADDFESLVHHCFEHGVNVTVVPRSLRRMHTRIEIRRTRSDALLEVYPQGLWLPQLAVKRAMDILGALLILLLTAPILALIAIAIKLDSPGPVLFKQVRAGLGGRPFRMYKFRTMVADADRLKAKLQHLNESGDPRLFKIRNDPRITRVGRWLRKTSLDELPQVFNVLRGDMSLVGPRPFFPSDLEDYEPHHFERLTVLPGITGLWQVSGRSDIIDFEEVVRLDSAYIRNWSIGRDLWILMRTLPAAFGRGGAY